MYSGVEPEKATSVKKTVRWTVFSEEREGAGDRADSMQGKAAADDDPCYPHQKSSFVRMGIFTFSLFTIHSSLFFAILYRIFVSNK